MTSKAILVVDDVPEARNFLSHYLTSLGCRVLTASDAFDALEIATKFGFDLLLTDFHMPRMNGLELARRIRTIKPEIRVIICTSGVEADIQKAICQEGYELILKPFSLEDLRELVLA